MDWHMVKGRRHGRHISSGGEGPKPVWQVVTPVGVASNHEEVENPNPYPDLSYLEVSVPSSCMAIVPFVPTKVVDVASDPEPIPLLGNLDDSWIETHFDPENLNIGANPSYYCHSHGGEGDCPFDSSSSEPMDMIGNLPFQSMPLQKYSKPKKPLPPLGVTTREVELAHLPKNNSDHKALVLQCKHHDIQGARPFRFINSWIHHDHFLKVVKDAWAKSPTFGGMRGLVSKLQDLKKALRDWNTKEFGNISVRKEKGLHTKEAISEEAISFFKDQFSADHSSAPNLIFPYIPQTISDLDNDLLTALPDMEEVRSTIWQMDGDSASGPDGFNENFLKASWDIIKEDVLKASLEFFKGLPIPKAYGSTFLTLIPKKDDPRSFNDFRPISLSTFMSKINTKILANGLLNHHLDHNFISRFNVGSIKWVGHLAYADDLMIFTKGDSRNLLKLKHILSQYLQASGQEVNLSKSRFYTALPLRHRRSLASFSALLSSSSMDNPPEGYCRNVGICLMNPTAKKIFAASRLDMPNAWQMPQGGVDENENPRDAAIRELREETGVTSAKIIAEAPHWMAYDFPPHVREKLKQQWGSD
ncbi:unnamed protein product [Cuscuta campestris]|uniref:Nudix hydrolase domain-containing protein n=1 Tax=Cuscuta campestris TaxID=132261 RepID=A0A484KDG1_9ASTE|nr:unnamed protein product [Cuscuta campestris]